MVQVERYQHILEEHLDMYKHSILQALKTQFAMEWLLLIKPSENDRWCKPYYAMAISRTQFLVHWIVSNEIFVRAHNTIGKFLDIQADDSDNLGLQVCPKDEMAAGLLDWIKKLPELRKEQGKMWKYAPYNIEIITTQLQIWYRKLRCTRLKQQNGFYRGNEGQLKWNKCVNMIRTQYIIIGIIQETYIFLDRVIQLIESGRITTTSTTGYKWDRELLVQFKERYVEYKESTENINFELSLFQQEISDEEYSSDDNESWTSEDLEQLNKLPTLQLTRN